MSLTKNLTTTTFFMTILLMNNIQTSIIGKNLDRVLLEGNESVTSNDSNTTDYSKPTAASLAARDRLSAAKAKKLK